MWQSYPCWYMMLAGEKNHLNSRLSASQALPQHFSLRFGIILGCLQSFWKQDFQLCVKNVYIWIFCGFFYDFSIISRWFLSLRNTKYHHPEDSFLFRGQICSQRFLRKPLDRVCFLFRPAVRWDSGSPSCLPSTFPVSWDYRNMKGICFAE